MIINHFHAHKFITDGLRERFDKNLLVRIGEKDDNFFPFYSRMKVKCRATHLIVGKPSKTYKMWHEYRRSSSEPIEILGLRVFKDYQVRNRERESPAGGACALNVNLRLNSKQSLTVIFLLRQ